MLAPDGTILFPSQRDLAAKKGASRCSRMPTYCSLTVGTQVPKIAFVFLLRKYPVTCMHASHEAKT